MVRSFVEIYNAILREERLQYRAMSRALEYSTKELTNDTLPDFERLFEKHLAPGAFMCWCMYHQRARPLDAGSQLPSRVKEAARNRHQKRELVEKGRSHGILVYSKGEPVGWCQYGSREELPRIDSNPGYRRLASESDMKRLWRITCFTVDKKYRRQGVASVALKAALESIRNKGGVSLKPTQSLGGELTEITLKPSPCSRRRDSKS